MIYEYLITVGNKFMDEGSRWTDYNYIIEDYVIVLSVDGIKNELFIFKKGELILQEKESLFLNEKMNFDLVEIIEKYIKEKRCKILDKLNS